MIASKPQPTFSLTLNALTLNEGITQSELSLKDECSFKWNLNYNNRLTRNDYFNWPLQVGQGWHNFQELWRAEKGGFDIESRNYFPSVADDVMKDTEFDKWQAYWDVILPAYCLAYAKLYKGEEKMDYYIIEQEVEVEFRGFKLRGKIDLAYDGNGGRFIRDFKSTSSAWLISPDGWHYKLQFMFYCWLVWKLNPDFVGEQVQFQLDMMQRPALKQTKADGTWEGHIRRVALDVRDRAAEYYLTRKSALITIEQIKRFEVEVLIPKLDQFQLVIDNPELAVSIISNKNTNACNNFGKPCEFAEICKTGWDSGKFFFSNREQKHREL